MLPHAELASRIRNMAPPACAEKLIASLQPSLRIRCDEPGGEIALGQSRFGGWPDVPPSFQWPTCVALSNPRWWRQFYERQYGRNITDDTVIEGGLRTLGELLSTPMYDTPKPLTLLAQINLAELPRDVDLDLPRHGHLLFFCDMGDELVSGGSSEPLDRWRVYFFDLPPDQLTRMPSPADDPNDPPEACVLQFNGEWTLDEELRYEQGQEVEEAFLRVREMLIGSWGQAQHRLLGNPQPIQGGMLGASAEMTLRQLGYDERLSEAEAEEANRTWRSLLQLDGLDALRWSWGDGGRVHYVIRDDDLKALRFDRVMVDLQCH